MKQITHYKSVIVIFILIIICQANAFGQVKINSPYSRFGLGDLNSGSNISQSTIGGAGYGVIDPIRISTINPSSYTNIDSGSFLINVAVESMFTNTKSQTQSSTSNYFNLGYINFAFPITKWWKTSLGLLPYSSVGYNINGYETVDSIGKIRNGHIGSGGVNKFYWGNGFKLTKKIAVGINASYLFGDIDISQDNEMLDQTNTFQYKISNSTHLRSIYLDYGIQYKTNFGRDNKYFLGLGLVYAQQQNFNATKSKTAYTFSEDNSGTITIKDTILDNKSGKGKVIIPTKIGGGFSIGKTNKWLFAADATFDEWSKFESFGINQNLNNSIRYNLGGRYYIGKYILSGGFLYNNSNLTINKTKINNYGITFGVGIPLRSNSSTISYVDLGFEFGKRGTTSNDLIQQDYFKFKLGINIKNTWFQRPKYL